MTACDANDATWYAIRYAEDFATLAGAPADSSAPFAQPSSPVPRSDVAVRSAARRAGAPARGVQVVASDPPPGVAVDVDGEIYCVDGHGRLVVIRCDGSRAPVICEPGVLAEPCGLALDRRGFLYVADRAAARVVVLSPDDGGARAILAGGGPIDLLVEPVDVAVAPSGLIYGADRKGGGIAIFSAGMKPLAIVPHGGGSPARRPSRSPS